MGTVAANGAELFLRPECDPGACARSQTIFWSRVTLGGEIREWAQRLAAEFEGAGARAAEAGRGVGWRDEIRRARAFYAARITSAAGSAGGGLRRGIRGEWFGESAGNLKNLKLRIP